MKLLYKFLFLSFIFLAKLAFADSTTCVMSGSLVNDATACFTTATRMEFPVLKVALCTSKPTAPTLTTPVDLSNCTTLLSNSTGNVVTVRKNGLTQMPGIVTSQQVMSGGTYTGKSYTYAYIESSAYASVQATATFTSNRTGVENPGSPGTTCWTTTATFYSFGPVPTSGSRCGSSASNVGLTTIYLNSLGTNAAYMNYTSTSNGVTTDTYLVDSNLRQAAATTSGSMGTVSKIINIQTLPVTITQTTRGIKASVNVSEGAWILQQSGGSPDIWFQNGNANLILSLCGAGGCN